MEDVQPFGPLAIDAIKSLGPAAVAAGMSSFGNQIQIDFPMTSIGSTADPADIAIDYLHALYFGEKIAPFCDSITSEGVKIGIDHFMRFSILSTREDMVSELFELADFFHPDDEDFDNDIPGHVSGLLDELFERKVMLPEIADNYMANFLEGSIFKEEPEAWLKRFPIWESGFWRSFSSDHVGCEVYTSNDTTALWIVLGSQTQVSPILARYGGLAPEGCQLFDASILHVSGTEPVAVSRTCSVHVPMQELDHAFTCVSRYIAPALAKGSDSARMGSWETFLENSAEFLATSSRYALTENGDVVVCGNEHINVVAFLSPEDRLRPEKLLAILGTTETIADSLREQAGLNAPALNWENLNPESFENLCCEILLRTGRFDERTLRKHGKTRSRDGGRDIEVWTYQSLHCEPTKWVVQCKFLTSGSSLGGSRVVVSDVVDQYGASGFGVMTNAVIDSTLYDKLDAIGLNRSVDTDTWDGSRLQRAVALRPDLRRRYFN